MHTQEYSFLQEFIDEVIIEGESPELWHKGSVITVECSLKDQLAQSKEILLKNIGYPFFLIKAPLVDSWKQGASVGNPARIDETTTYKTEIPKNTSSYGKSHIQLYPVELEKVDVMYVRWIAQRVARYLYSKNLLKFPITPNMLDDISSLETWSPEVIKAFNGLNEELKSNLSIETIVPGYGGEDKWYE